MKDRFPRSSEIIETHFWLPPKRSGVPFPLPLGGNFGTAAICWAMSNLDLVSTSSGPTLPALFLALYYFLEIEGSCGCSLNSTLSFSTLLCAAVSFSKWSTLFLFFHPLNHQLLSGLITTSQWSLPSHIFVAFGIHINRLYTEWESHTWSKLCKSPYCLAVRWSPGSLVYELLADLVLPWWCFSLISSGDYIWSLLSRL